MYETHLETLTTIIVMMTFILFSKMNLNIVKEKKKKNNNSLLIEERLTTFILPFHKSIIRKTCPCNEYPLKPHFYIVKLGFARVYLFFLFLLQNIDCGYSLEPPRRGGSNVYPQSMF